MALSLNVTVWEAEAPQAKRRDFVEAAEAESVRSCAQGQLLMTSAASACQ
jgi:hypothetical protein